MCGLVSSEFMRIFRELRFPNLHTCLHPSRGHITRCFNMSANNTKKPAAGGKNEKDKPVEKKELKILMLHGKSFTHPRMVKILRIC